MPGPSMPVTAAVRRAWGEDSGHIALGRHRGWRGPGQGPWGTGLGGVRSFHARQPASYQGRERHRTRRTFQDAEVTSWSVRSLFSSTCLPLCNRLLNSPEGASPSSHCVWTDSRGGGLCWRAWTQPSRRRVSQETLALSCGAGRGGEARMGLAFIRIKPSRGQAVPAP